MSLAALREALLAHGGTVAALVGGADPADRPADPADRPAVPGDGPADPAGGPAGPGASQPGVGAPQRAAQGPRTSRRAAEYELLLEMILEGSRLHYGSPLLVRAADPDLQLLLGDQLYALGLERLAALGDLDAVRELADVISLVGQAHAERNPARADAIWVAGAVALGWGPAPAHEAAKALARAGVASATAELYAAAHRDGR